MEKNTVKILGMHCASCATTITKELEKNPHITSAPVNFLSKKVTVTFNENKINIEQIEKIIINTGYKIDKQKNTPKQTHTHHEGKYQLYKVIISSILTAPFIIRMFIKWEIPGSFFNISNTDWVQHNLAFIVVFFFGWQFHKNAASQLTKLQVNMDSLISLGTLTAYFYSLWVLFNTGHLYFEAAATITTLILIGRYLEEKTKNRASATMKKLMELNVNHARVITKSGEMKKVNISNIKIGTIILVKPSEKIPLDGTVVEGTSSVNESVLTGESLPQTKKKNSNVFASTINQNSTLKIKVTKNEKETILSQIIKSVEEAQNTKPPMQKFADKISSIFVPVIIVIAFITFITWFLLTGNSSIAIINAISVLIISCPCALGIATPIAVMVGSSIGAKNGILIKNGESFEKAKNIDTIIFDKTGTLTKGKPQLTKILKNKKYNFTELEILKIANKLARNSEHPISKAIHKKAKKENIYEKDICKFKETPGQGLSGTCKIHKSPILLGNIELLKKKNINTNWAEEIINKYKKSEFIITFLSHEKNLIGAFLISDQLRDNAKETIQEIKRLNIEPIILSGDNKTTTKLIADKLKIKNFKAKILPTEKQNEIKKIQKKGKNVIFIGDGINDAPALTQSNLGIALRSGTDIARESGDIILMQDNPYKAIEAIKLSQDTFKIIKQNIFWAFFYNSIAIPLAILGLVNPMIGAIAMSFSDISVIGNSLRLYKKHPSPEKTQETGS